MVSVLVGAEKKLFQVHKSFVANASDFCKVLFEGSFKEAKEEAITLEEDDPDAFEDFLQQMYTNRHEIMETYVEDDTIRQSAELKRHINLFIFADKVQILSLKHRITDLIHGKIRWNAAFPVSTLRYLYHQFDVVRPLRQLIMAYYVWHISIEIVAVYDYDYDDLRRSPDIAIDYLVFADLRCGDKKVSSLFHEGPAYFYEDVLEKYGLRSGGRPAADDVSDSSDEEDGDNGKDSSG